MTEHFRRKNGSLLRISALPYPALRIAHEQLSRDEPHRVEELLALRRQLETEEQAFPALRAAGDRAPHLRIEQRGDIFVVAGSDGVPVIESPTWAEAWFRLKGGDVTES